MKSWQKEVKSLGGFSLPDFPGLVSYNLPEPETVASWKQGVQERETPDKEKFWLFSGKSGGRKAVGNGLGEGETASGRLFGRGKLR